MHSAAHAHQVIRSTSGYAMVPALEAHLAFIFVSRIFLPSRKNSRVCRLSTRAPAPHRLEKAIPLREAVQAVVALGPRAHEPA